MLPLLLLPLLIFWLAQRHLPILERRTVALVAGGLLFFLGAWFIRNFILTGCLVYPVNATCVYSLPWTVTPFQVQNEAAEIASWARQPFASPTTVMANWDWLVPWLQELSGVLDLWLAFAAFGVGMVLLLVRRKHTNGYNARVMLLLLGVLFVGGTFWFLTAPDLRFGVSWFWAIGLIVLALGLYKMFAVSFSLPLLRLAAMILFAAAAFSVAGVGIGYAQRGGWGIRSALLAVPPIAVGDLQVKRTLQGRDLLVTTNEPRCFWEAMCTPYFDARLQIDVLSDGRLAFYPAPALQ